VTRSTRDEVLCVGCGRVCASLGGYTNHRKACPGPSLIPLLDGEHLPPWKRYEMRCRFHTIDRRGGAQAMALGLLAWVLEMHPGALAAIIAGGAHAPST
jgi:hypothetical protein